MDWERSIKYLRRGFLINVLATVLNVGVLYVAFSVTGEIIEKWYINILPEEWAERELVRLGINLMLIYIFGLVVAAITLYAMWLLWRGYGNMFDKRSAPAVGSLLVMISIVLGFFEPLTSILLWVAGASMAFILGVYRLWKILHNVKLEIAVVLYIIAVILAFVIGIWYVGLFYAYSSVYAYIVLAPAFMAQGILATVALLLTYLALQKV